MKQYIVVAIVLVIVFYFFFWRVAAAATMQNDTESIALPTGVVDGQTQVIYDNPDLVTEWAEGSNDPYAEYLAYIAATLTVSGDGTVTITLGNDATGDAAQTLLNSLGSDSGLALTPTVPSTSVAGSGSAGKIVIAGSKLRQALAEKGILSLDVKGWDFDDTAYVDDSEYYAEFANIDDGELAVIAAGVVFRDQNIEEVTLSGSRIFVRYRTDGWLLGFIPIRFAVELSINASGTTDASRVSVKFPWYRFFTWLRISPVELAANLNASIIGIQAAGLDTNAAQARLFSYVGAILRSQNATDVSGLPPAGE